MSSSSVSSPVLATKKRLDLLEGRLRPTSETTPSPKRPLPSSHCNPVLSPSPVTILSPPTSAPFRSAHPPRPHNPPSGDCDSLPLLSPEPRRTPHSPKATTMLPPVPPMTPDTAPVASNTPVTPLFAPLGDTGPIPRQASVAVSKQALPIASARATITHSSNTSSPRLPSADHRNSRAADIPPPSPGSSNETTSSLGSTPSGKPRARKPAAVRDPTPSKKRRSIKDLFAATESGGGEFQNPLQAAPTSTSSSSSSSVPVPALSALDSLASIAEERERLQKLSKDLDERAASLERLSQDLSSRQHSRASLSAEGLVPMSVIKPIFTALLIQIDELQRQESRRTLALESFEIGGRTLEHAGGQLVEGWSGGHTFNRINQRIEELNAESEERKKDRNRLSRERLNLVKRLPPASTEVDDELRSILIQEQAAKVRLAEIRKEILDADREKSLIVQRRNAFVKEHKRIAAEDQSRFNDHP
ncbi:MAG: hypothetical protein Q8P67_20735, partial [archaeon]|nr:hypothetical protein [archaeon]